MTAPYPNIRISDYAGDLLRCMVRRDGPQALVMTGAAAAPSIVHVRPLAGFRPGPGDVLIAQLASCLVYADEDSICSCPHEQIVLSPARLDGPRLVSLVTRPESEAERQQRLFNCHVPMGHAGATALGAWPIAS
ncbi:MAG TPA: hypothetical protein VHI14_02275 [Jatrophihabitantaceae bacterium]|nr:hypothetical protein [Jatrophihabitantaceae bacterium]